MAERPSSVNSYSLTWTMLLSSELTRLQSGWKRKALPNKTLDKFKSFKSLLADLQGHHGHGLRSAIPTLQFAPVPKRSC